MTDYHSKQPTEQNEGISKVKTVHPYDKNNVAIVRPLVFKSKGNSDYTDNSHYGIPDTGRIPVKMEGLILKDFLAINGQLATTLSNMLNQRNNRVVRNWQHLAEALKVPPDVSSSFDCDSEHSPTEDLFDYLNTWNPDMTFAQLKGYLRSASRNDLVQVLDRDGYQNNWKISDNMEFVEIFRDKLDISKRHMDWRSLASKLKIPKKTFNQFGAPKQGPTKQLFLHVRISHSFEDLTIKKLKEYLEAMDRFDVLKVFERYKILDNAYVKDELKQQIPIMDELSELLDKEGPMKNWKNLAYRMGIAEKVYEGFDVSRVHNRNPTKLLLEWIFSQDPHCTVGKFLKCLRDIERNDAVEELKNGIQQQGIKEQNFNHTSSLHASNESSEGFTSNLTPETKLSQNWHHLSEEERCALLVTQLPQSLYQKLCQMLDTTEAFFRDYRMFAEELGIDKITINSLEKKESPSHTILLQNRLNINDFLKIMKKIDREDIVVELERWLKTSSI